VYGGTVTADMRLRSILDALGPVAALDVSLVASYLARAQSGRVYDSRDVKLYDVSNGVAVITIEGPLAKTAAAWGDYVWLDGYDRIGNAIAKAAKDTDVDAVVLRLDTPGGVVSGLSDMVEEAMSALSSAGKRSIAWLALGASAGYWIACMADEIFVGNDGGAGSIGTMAAHYDISRALELAGVKVTIIEDPDGKSSGASTKPLDEEGRERWQEFVSASSERFYAHVAGRRNVSAKSIRDMRAKVFYGQSAVQAGLADGVLSWSKIMARAGAVAQEKQRMNGLFALLGLAANASAEEVSKATAEAQALLSLGRAALELTGEANAEAAKGVVIAWKKDAADAAQLRAEAATAAKESDAKERTSLFVALAQVEPPAHVWADTNNLAAGAVHELAEMSTPALRAYVGRRSKVAAPAAMRQSETNASATEPSDAEVIAHMKREGIKHEAVARADLRQQRGLK